jgi:hypothetical protein
MDLQAELPLEEGVLTSNFGIPFFIICTKVGLKKPLIHRSTPSRTSPRKKNVNLNTSSISCVILRCSVRYFLLFLDGATIIYTSSKDSININVFYEYLVHRFYGFECTLRPNPKNYIFIPSGFDSPNLIK